MARFREHRWTILTVAVVALLLAPVALDRDSYPLSTYPMYAEARPAVVDLPTAVGVDADGGIHRLSLSTIGSSDDPLIVAGAIREAIARGVAAGRCRDIAERVSNERPDASRGRPLVAIEVVVERRDVVAHVRGADSLVERTVEARCAVPGHP